MKHGLEVLQFNTAETDDPFFDTSTGSELIEAWANDSRLILNNPNFLKPPQTHAERYFHRAFTDLFKTCQHPSKISDFRTQAYWLMASLHPHSEIHEAQSIAILHKHIPDLTPYVATARLLSR